MDKLVDKYEERADLVDEKGVSKGIDGEGINHGWRHSHILRGERPPWEPPKPPVPEVTEAVRKEDDRRKPARQQQRGEDLKVGEPPMVEIESKMRESRGDQVREEHAKQKGGEPVIAEQPRRNMRRNHASFVYA